MSNECKGLFGKLFGHDFDKFMIKDPSIVYKFTEASISNETVKLFSKIILLFMKLDAKDVESGLMDDLYLNVSITLYKLV